MAKAKSTTSPAIRKEKKKKENIPSILRNEKTIHLNYFQLELDNLKEKADNAKRISAAFKASSKNYTTLVRAEDDSRISLLGRKLYSKNGGLIFGTLIHTKTRDFPFAFDDNSQTASELPIPDDQGLATGTSFLFDPEVNIVMIESVKDGVGIGAFCQFFERNLALESLDAGIVIDPADIQRLQSFKLISKVQFKIARLQGASPFKGEKTALGSLIKTADATNTNILEMTMTSGRARNSTLLLSTTMAMIDEIRRHISKENKDVKKMLVTGRSSTDGYSAEIDLIKQRIRSEIKVEVVRKNNITSIEQRYNSLYSAYVEHKQKLHRAYKI